MRLEKDDEFSITHRISLGFDEDHEAELELLLFEDESAALECGGRIISLSSAQVIRLRIELNEMLARRR